MLSMDVLSAKRGGGYGPAGMLVSGLDDHQTAVFEADAASKSTSTSARGCGALRVLRRRLCGPGGRRFWRLSDLRQLRMQDLIMHPEQCAFLETWDLLAILCLVFLAVVAPLQLSLMDPKLDFLFAVNCVVDMVFLVDLVMHFFLMYPKKTNYGYIYEDSPRAIVVHYLRTWFAVDVISVMPFDIMAMTMHSQHLQQTKAIKAVRMLRCVKMMRVLKASRLMRRCEVHMSITYGTFALLKFFVFLLLITHWLANLWALTLVMVDESEGLPRWIDGFEELDKNVEAKTKDTPWKIYMQSLYFTSYTVTSVGYGDIGPQNTVETLVSIIMIVVSGVSWAVVLGEVCGIISQMRPDESAFRSTMDELNHMMQDRMVPRDMRRRLRSFFLSKKVADRRERQVQIIDSMSAGLQGQLVMWLNRMWISKVSFLNQILHDADRTDSGAFFYAFVVDVSMAMDTAIHAQSEVFGVVQTLYILNRGIVARSSPIRADSPGVPHIGMGVSNIHSAGAVWGVDFVLSDMGLLEPPESLALTYVEAMMLKRHSFFELVEKHREGCPELKRKVRRFCCWLAFQRALLLEAKKRRYRLAKQKCARHEAELDAESAAALTADEFRTANV